jgi:hypothetical protein
MEISGLGDVLQFSKHVNVRGGESGLYGGWGGVQKWLREQDGSSYSQGLENLIAFYDKCLKKFRNHMEKYSTDVQRYLMIFLSSLTSSHVKIMENLTFSPLLV